ncbi:MAG: hypothetical protein LC808_30680 [Actinobacteria bacterium]|nr:hypothetical protein [Actinomycetota bacterium]
MALGSVRVSAAASRVLRIAARRPAAALDPPAVDPLLATIIRQGQVSARLAVVRPPRAAVEARRKSGSGDAWSASGPQGQRDHGVLLLVRDGRDHALGGQME